MDERRRFCCPPLGEECGDDVVVVVLEMKLGLEDDVVIPRFGDDVLLLSFFGTRKDSIQLYKSVKTKKGVG